MCIRVYLQTRVSRLTSEACDTKDLEQPRIQANFGPAVQGSREPSNPNSNSELRLVQRLGNLVSYKLPNKEAATMRVTKYAAVN